MVSSFLVNRDHIRVQVFDCGTPPQLVLHPQHCPPPRYWSISWSFMESAQKIPIEMEKHSTRYSQDGRGFLW